VQKLKCIPTALLLQTVALGAASSVDWLREAKYGAFMHLLPSDAKTLAVVETSTSSGWGQLESIGAKYFVLTLGQNSGYFNATCRVRRRRGSARAQKAFGLAQGKKDQPIDLAFAQRWAAVLRSGRTATATASRAGGSSARSRRPRWRKWQRSDKPSAATEVRT
jgi:hypothetical protein